MSNYMISPIDIAFVAVLALFVIGFIVASVMQDRAISRDQAASSVRGQILDLHLARVAKQDREIAASNQAARHAEFLLNEELSAQRDAAYQAVEVAVAVYEARKVAARIAREVSADPIIVQLTDDLVAMQAKTAQWKLDMTAQDAAHQERMDRIAAEGAVYAAENLARRQANQAEWDAVTPESIRLGMSQAEYDAELEMSDELEYMRFSDPSALAEYTFQNDHYNFAQPDEADLKF